MLTTVAVVQFLVTVDLSIVNIALPQIGDHLGFTPVDLTWVINAYALAFGGLLLLGGKASDRYGRRRVLTSGSACSALASLAGGLATSPAALVAARAVQGAGAAALGTGRARPADLDAPTGPARARAFGVWSAVNASGGAFGVVAGGLLTQYAGWRSVMFVNVPLVAVALVFAASRHRQRPTDNAVDPDVPILLGAALVTAGMSLLVLGVVRTDLHPWPRRPR